MRIGDFYFSFTRENREMYGENDMKWGEEGEMYGEIERMGTGGQLILAHSPGGILARRSESLYRVGSLLCTDPPCSATRGSCRVVW